jgi:hypothetical protein
MFSAVTAVMSNTWRDLTEEFNWILICCRLPRLVFVRREYTHHVRYNVQEIT